VTLKVMPELVPPTVAVRDSFIARKCAAITNGICRYWTRLGS
jgi:hypothetical protein